MCKQLELGFIPASEALGKKALSLANSTSLYVHGVDQEPLNINKQDCVPASAHVLSVDSMHAVWHMCFWCICVYTLV